MLSKINRDEWLSIILKPASKFGYETDFWTSNRICVVIEEKFKLCISKWTIWRKLRELGLTYQKPEKMYFEASEEDRRKWRQYELPKIRRAVKKYKAILYFQDESNISLSAILGKTWAPKGQTPIQKVTGKRGGVAAMSAISGTGSLISDLLYSRNYYDTNL
ncbi:MAG: winged helix-turn-helix domain-containing protein [Candidatus Anammoxibacter sp.]